MPGPSQMRKRKYSSQTNDSPRMPPHPPGNVGQYLDQQSGGRQNQSGRDMRHQNRGRQPGRGGWNNNNQGGGGGGDRRGGQGGGVDRYHQQHSQSGHRDRAPPPATNPRQLPQQHLVSAPQTPQISTPTLTPLHQPVPDVPCSPSENLGYFYWEYITDARVKFWSTTGEAEVVQQTVSIYQDNDSEALSIVFHEILQSCISSSRLSVSVAARSILSIISATAPQSSHISSNMNDSRILLLSSLSFFEEGPFSSKLVQLVRHLIDAGSPLLPESLFLAHLDSQTLVSLNLVSATFPRRNIRISTQLIYKQQKYNLLREESEGYSKLITEFFTSSYSPSPLEVVDRTLDNVKALVGAFDLDPARVLDVLLDTFACTLVANCRFFVRILKGGPWWPEEHTRNVLIDGDFFTTLRGGNTEMTPPEEIKSFFRTLLQSKRSGNKDAAQLLGFKSRYYWRKEVREQTPDNLMVLSALLIKIGFVRLTDLWPHLGPSAEKTDKKVGQEEEGELGSEEEEYMQGVLEKWKKNMEEKANKGKLNALMMAGALSDDTVPTGLVAGSSSGGLKKDDASVLARGSEADAIKAEDREKDKEKPKEPVDQKIPLLRHLLAMGALPEAMVILGKYDWICGPEPEIADHIHRIVHFSIEDVYASSRPAQTLTDRVFGVSKRIPESSTIHNFAPTPTTPVAILGGKTNLVERPKRRITRTPSVFWSHNKTDDVEFRFFWDDWTDGVPKCRNVDDILLLGRTLLRFSGVRIGRDTGLMAKICRIGKKDVEDAISDCTPNTQSSTNSDDGHMDVDTSQDTISTVDGSMQVKKVHKEKVMASWCQMLRELLLPAVSLTGANPGIVNEVWSLLCYFPIESRYRLYGEWVNIHCKRVTELKVKTSEIEKETKDLLKRISKTNVKQMARALAKVAMSNPATVFSVVLNQIEAYDNLVDCVVDAARYFTVLGYDVLVYTICTQLGVGGEGRGGRGGDGMGRRKWLNGKYTLYGPQHHG